MAWGHRGTVRFDLRSPLEPVVKEAGLASHLDYIVELCQALLFLHEEGRHLKPLLVLSASRDETTAMMANAAGTNTDEGEIHDLTLVPARELTATIALKSVAVLFSGVWVPCLELEPRKAVLLRRSCLPFNTPAQIIKHSIRSRKIIVLHKLCDGYLEVVGGPSGQVLDLLADPSLEPDPQGVGPVEQLMSMLNEDRANHGGPPFLERQRFVLARVLDHSHGALVAVATASKIDEAFRAFDTAVRVDPPIDLHAKENILGPDAAQSSRAAGVARPLDPLDVTERGSMQLTALLHAMLGMDGIVVVSSKSYLHGYRCFVRPHEGGAGMGGARRLAYEALVNDERFLGALYRSQDGAMRVHRRHN